MATYFARATGNINGAIWATTPAGAGTTVTFASGDVLLANSFTITINVSTNLGSTGEIRNDTTGGATAGGGFTLNASVTLTANCFAGSTSTACITFSSAFPAVGYIVGNVTGGTGSSNSIGVNNSGTGNLYITGSITGGSGNASSFGCQASAGGNVYITGNVTGGSLGEGAKATNGGNLYITGNVTGGSGSAYGARNLSAGSIVVTGQAIASATTTAILNGSTGTVSVIRAVGNGYGVGSIGQSLVPAVDNAVQGSITIVQELEWGALGAPPTNGVIRLSPISSNLAKFYTGTGVKTLIDATQANQPAVTDVRSGVSYASGALVGTCAVPAAGSVALGVPVDATTGTAILTQANVQTALTAQGYTTARSGNLDNLDTAVSSRLAPSGTLATVTTLTNAPTSVTPSDIWSHASRTLTTSSGPTAVQIRQEMDSNSTQLTAIKAKTDNLPAAPAAVSNIPTADQNAAAVWSKPTTELTITGSIGERAKNQSTVSTTGAQLAAALS